MSSLKRTSLVAGTRTNNKLNRHVKLGPGIEPRPQRSDAGALTTAACLHLPKPNKRPNNEQPNEPKQTKGRPNKKAAESAGNMFTMKRNQNIIFVSCSFEKVAFAVHASRE